ncbi:MAG: ABC transporter permease [Alphaproteobacteria bacterium]|nr:ABC transporter permease [Alphaproteobacteria bacterium]
MKIARILVPFLFGVGVLALWEMLVRINNVPIFVLPGPWHIGSAFFTHAASLMSAFWFTLQVTLIAFASAAISGIGLAILFTRSRWIEMTLWPYMVTLQVTPIIAIAPLILIWVGFDNTRTALVIIATIVAFFPILSNTILGIRSADPNLRNLFRLYKANWWQTLWRLELASALPFIISGAKIAGGLALIGAVVAEFAAGSGTATGLAWRIIEAGNRLQIDKMFAALLLLSLLGMGIFYTFSFIGWLCLRHWHSSELNQDISHK